jgi:hypothetical protein
MPARLLTQTNTGGSARLAANWLSSLHKLGIADRAHIFCTDQGALLSLGAYCEAQEVPASVSRTLLSTADDSVPPGPHPFGTKHFIRFTLWKLDLLQQLALAQSFQPFLFCDPDVVLLRDPESAFEVERATVEGQTLWFGSDRKDYLKPDATNGEYCTGIIYETAAEPIFWLQVYQWLASRMPTTTGREGPNFIHDQTAANAIIHQWKGFQPGYLSPELFRNGAHEWRGNPVLIHSNWVIGNEVKEKRLKDAGLWFANDATLNQVGL